MWKKSKIIKSNYNLIKNFLINMLYFKKIETVSTAISYKNRFLVNKRSCKNQFLGLIQNDGFKLKKLKMVNKIYLNFLYYFHNLNTFKLDFNIINKNKINMGEFINLYNTFYLFKTWDRALIWRMEENLPIIKVVSKKIKKKKQKKKIKKKRFNLEYKYIKKNKRFQVGLKWLSLIIKTSELKLNIGLLHTFIPFLINPKQSKFITLKKKIYTNLLLNL